LLQLARRHRAARSTAATQKNAAWTGAENNDVGIHEFMNLRQFTITGVPLAEQAEQWIIGSTDSEAHNEPGKPPVVTIIEKNLTIAHNTLNAPPLSIALYRLDKNET
jgi:alpha-L-arabinofuranosidase